MKGANIIYPTTPDRYPNLVHLTGEEQKFGDMTVIVLATFDCDWEVWHFIQVWSPEIAKWQYNLLYAGSTTGHVPTVYWDWESRRPSWTEAAKKVDDYYEAPHSLRGLLRPN
jgi:hypothetical protein